MPNRDDELQIRPGRIQHGNRGGKRPTSFVGEVMRAAKKAGHTGRDFGGPSGPKRRSSFGRGRAAALSLSSRSPGRRVVVMTRIVRHQGKRFSAAPLVRHVAYLKREGVTRDGQDARMFDASSDSADTKAFAERCEEDRHHFRFTVSPEDATQMADLHGFTRELMQDAERDLGTKLDWVAVDHWNTDNPHIHVLVRGKADDGKDLVISRDYISHGFRQRAAERVTLELGPRSEQETSGSRWNSAHVASRKSAPAWRRRSRRIAGPVSIELYRTSPTRVAVLPICGPAMRKKTRNCAASCSAALPSSNGWASPNRSGWPDGRSSPDWSRRCATSVFAATSSRPCTGR
jgi:hypothetical protein